MTDAPQNSEVLYVAPKEAPPSRKPPANTVGVVGWLRENLFNGPVNSVMTVLIGLLVAWFIINIIDWTVTTAGWTVINNNLRLLMVGQYERDELWRVGAVAVVLIVLSGVSVGYWSEVPRPVFLTIIITLAVFVAVPLVSELFPAPSVRAIVSPEYTVPPLRFVGDAGEEVTVQIEEIVPDAINAQSANGFIEADPGTANSRTVWNDLKQDLAQDNLDLGDYDLAFDVTLVNAQGEALETLSVSADTPEPSFSFTLPEPGWYGILTQTQTLTSGFAWVRIEGIDTFTTRTADVERRESIYGPAPTFEDACAEGESDCTIGVAQRLFRYEGERGIYDYLSLQLAPFFRDTVIPIAAAIGIAFLGGLVGYAIQKRLPLKTRQRVNWILLVSWFAFMPISLFLLSGIRGAEALPYVPSNLWGGLLLTMALTVVPIVASFPLGILLALGRANENLTMVSTLCTIFIEVVRGVPLITILFFAELILPFFIGASTDIELATRMMVGLTLFTAAYVAEVIRGGLQIIPDGQEEAAQALGLNSTQVTWLITMPQAIRAVIPALMSQFVSLFKDTTLVSIIGLFELLGIVELIVNGQQQYRPFQREAYLFVGVLYFVISLVMTSISRRLENTGVGAARQ